MPDYRNDFFDFSPTIYLDCANQGPFPRRTVERIQQAIELKKHPERLQASEYMDLPDRVRGHLAQIIGADPSDIALTNSATQGIGLVASGLAWGEGDEVVVASANFPSNLLTWIHLRRLGVRVHVVRPQSGMVRAADVAPAITPRTRVLALDWVNYRSGERIDLSEFGELVHKQGGVFVVDASQGIGAVELDASDSAADALAVAAYKWLLGPYGTGFVYLKPELRDRLELKIVNWLTVEGSEEFDSLPTDQFTLPNAARVFDVPETPSFLNLYALEASLQYVREVGVRTVNQHSKALLARLIDGLGRRGLQLSAAARPEC